MADRLEAIQRQALRIIYGHNTDIDDIMSVKNIKTLSDRREETMLRFALKNENKSRYGKRWFREKEEHYIGLRNNGKEKYKIPLCRTDRMSKNPITMMTRALNRHYAET